jgi:uncharacterized membrane protein YGL010W
MRTIDVLLNEYGESHLNKLNKAIHWVCIPLIVFSLMGLLASIPSYLISSWLPEFYRPYVNWSTIFLLITITYYFRLSFPLAIGMSLFAIACIIGNVWLSIAFPFPLWQTSLSIFVAAWIGQFIGHKIEGKKPSFFKDVQFLMIGPAWLLHFIYKKAGFKY